MADHKAPGQYVCDGVVLPGIVSRDVLERMKRGFTFDDSDVIIASYPKSGKIPSLAIEFSLIGVFFYNLC